MKCLPNSANKCRQYCHQMAKQSKFKVDISNVNSLQQHVQEIKSFLNDQNIDIMTILVLTLLTESNYRLQMQTIPHQAHMNELP